MGYKYFICTVFPSRVRTPHCIPIRIHNKFFNFLNRMPEFFVKTLIQLFPTPILCMPGGVKTT